MPKYTNRLKHKSHYENVPFEVPEGWVWTTIGEIASSILYGVSESAKETGQYKLLRITDIQNNKVNWETVPFTDYDNNKAQAYLLNDGDILFARTGATVGKSYLVEGLRDSAIYASYLIRVQTSSVILPAYIKFFFESGFYWEQISLNSVGIGQPNVNGTILAALTIPIPPYREQLRIVEEAKTWLSVIDRLDVEIDDLQTYITQAKSRILDLAIHGKLVPQDANDEPASELLKRINPKFVPCDNAHYENVPFEVPKNWLWLSHNAILDISGGSQPAKSYFKSKEEEGYIRLYQIRDYGETPVPVYIPRELANKTTQKGDILLARYGGSLGKVFIAEEGAYNVAMAKVIFKYDGLINKEYAYFYYLSSLYQDKLKSISRTAQAGFNSTDFEDMFFPLPPIAEQERIVGAINQYYRIFDNISAEL